MTAKKKVVALLFGGKSGEYKVSLMSASSVLQAIDLELHQVLPVGITPDGEWTFAEDALTILSDHLSDEVKQRLIKQIPDGFTGRRGQTFLSDDRTKIDAVLPILHGTYGEDGTIQGLFEMLQLPYVGAGVLASAVGMDKIISKILFTAAGLSQAKYVWYYSRQINTDVGSVASEIEDSLGYPCFVKPANLGSSVGISKADTRESLEKSLRFAANYDRKVVVEEFVDAREIEVAVLGNHEPKASVPGEIIASNDFYDYRAKYIDGKSLEHIPALLTTEQSEKIREMAVRAFQAIDGSGLSRVDFFVRKDNGQILINEINTLPGFTNISMYKKLWEYTGIPYSDQISQLIELALERYEDKTNLVTTFEEID